MDAVVDQDWPTHNATDIAMSQLLKRLGIAQYVALLSYTINDLEAQEVTVSSGHRFRREATTMP